MATEIGPQSPRMPRRHGERRRVAESCKVGRAAPKTRISRVEILQGLREFDRTRAEGERGGPFTMAAFNAWGGRRFDARIAARRYGRWRRALAEAGMRGRGRGVYD